MQDEGFVLEFSLLAEGLRKLATIALLLSDGVLGEKCTLYWDEPENNFNPKLITFVANILIRLENLGVQIFLSTHNYSILKEIELQKTEKNSVTFYAFEKMKDSNIKINQTNSYEQLSPNLISEAYLDLYDREIEQSFGD